VVDIRDIVNVQIRLESQAIQESNFGTPLVMAPHAVFPERVRAYSSASAMIQDGFESTDPAYLAVRNAFSPSPSAPRVLVGRRQVNSLTITVDTPFNTGQVFTVAVNGVNYQYAAQAADGVPEIEAGLKAAIDGALSGTITTTASGAGLIIAATTPGTAFTVNPATGLTLVQPSAADTVTDDITAIENEALAIGGFYGLIMTERTQSDVLEAAANTEASSQYRIFGAATDEAGAKLATSTSDLMALTKAAGYERTFVVYHDQAATVWPEATWMGSQFTQNPGASTWAFKRLPSIPTTDLTATESLVIRKNFGFGKNGNVFVRVRGAPITFEGTMASGEYIDNIRFRDWLEDQITVNIYSLLVNAPKVPYTDGGIGQIEARIRQSLERGIERGGISPAIFNPETQELEPSYVINLPRQFDVPFNEKANRRLTDSSFRAVLAGAIHHVELPGTLTVGHL